MKSKQLGSLISEVEVTNISKHGFWVLVGEEELFLPFQDFPWFEAASVSAILNVMLQGPQHLYWPDLDIDLTVESIKHPEKYPLISKLMPNMSVEHA
ncbi:MAG: DUF2442 domain-containing protein [Syntrophobacteraceae bacterium]